MSEPSTQEPSTGGAAPAAGPVPAPPPLPPQPLQYVASADRRAPPGLVSTIGIASIVIAAMSLIFGFLTALQAVAYIGMSLVAPSLAVAGRPRPMMVPPGVAYPAAGQAGLRGMSPAERKAAIAALNRRQSMLPSRKRQLDAILEQAGKDLGIDQVTDSGIMPKLQSPEAPPDYFVTATGRLELFNDRAVFYPTNGAPMIKVTARPQAPGPDAPAPPAPAEEAKTRPANETAEVEIPATLEAETPATAAGQPAAAAAPVFSVPPPGALTPAEVQAVVQQAQLASSNALSPAQARALSAILSAPGQQLVTPGASQGVIVATYAQPGGVVVLQFADGSGLSLGPQGQVMSINSGPAFPTFSFHPVALGLLLATSLASLALAVYLVVCGILMLRQSPRGRRLHLIYAGIKIPIVIAAGVAALWIETGMTGTAAGAAGVARVGIGVFSGPVPALLGLAYPVALLVLLHRRSMVDYFETGTGGGAAA